MIEQINLPNGVRVVTEHISHVRSVAIGIWVHAGSRYENEQTNGLSHFIEHMLFKGTTTRSAAGIAEVFDEIGGYVNAFTAKEYTCYYAKVLDEHTSVALDVLSDMFFNSQFDPNEIEKEKQVVVEEIRMVEGTPDDWVHDLVSEVSMPDDPLGYPILGSINNVTGFQREQLTQFIKNTYIPEHTVITVVGNFDQALHEQLLQLFGQFKQGDQFKQRVRKSPRFHAGIVQRVKPTEQAHLCLSLPGLALTDERIYSLVLLNSIIGGSMSSRLFQRIREEYGLAYSVYSYHSTFRDCGSFVIYAGTGPHQVDSVCENVLDILRDVRDNGVQASELHKAKQQLKGSFTLSMESTTNRMSRLGKNELLLGKHPSYEEVMTHVNRIRLSDLNALAEHMFHNELSFAIISPEERLPKSFRRDALV